MSARHGKAIGLALAAAVLAACTAPTAGRAGTDASSGPSQADEALRLKLWRATRVQAAVGEMHNIKPEEYSSVRAAVGVKSPEVRRCFEDVVRRRGCRTDGIAKAFDVMLMIDPGGTVQAVRIQPGKNDLPRPCDPAVNCVQDVFTGMQIQGLERFAGTRQACMTITVHVPAEETLAATDGGP